MYATSLIKEIIVLGKINKKIKMNHLKFHVLMEYKQY